MEEGSAAQLWQAVLLRLQSQVTRPNFDTWLKDTVGLRLESDPARGCPRALVVGARSDFATEWLSAKLRPAICRIVTSLAGQMTDVTFEVAGAPSPHRTPDPSAPVAEAPAVEALRLEPPASVRATGWPRPRLNPQYTFDTFVVGTSNRLAHSAAMAVASSPGTVYNPLVIFGGAGLGKTHLLHAIAHATLGDDRRVVYASAEQFTNDFAHASRDRRWDAFRQRYRVPDILIIDDIQFLEGKEHTLSELHHTFDELHGSSRQVVMATDRRPSEVPGLARLGSRLRAGLTADIQQPSLQLRVAILHAKASTAGLHLQNDVLQFLAAHSAQAGASVRDLEGCLLRVMAYARASRQSLTLDVATQAMRDLAPQAAAPSAAPDAVIAAVCHHFGLSRQLISGKSRDSQVAFARHVAMYLLRQESRCTLTAIGRLLGDRDHSTVLYGCTKIARELRLLPDTRQHVESLQALLHRPAA